MTEGAWSAPEYAAVARLVAERAGLAVGEQRVRGTEAKIRRAMARAGAVDPARYRLLLERDGGALDDLIVELTVGETYFFRDPEQLGFVRRDVLPEIRARRGDDHVVRAWSAGCASGEEAYSLAIILAEEGLADRARVHATDISRPALAKARAAIYPGWSLRGDGAAAARPYLRAAGGEYAVVEHVRRAVSFDRLNLALDVYPSFSTPIWGMDLVLCRNVLVYFDRETVRRVTRRLFASLADGGWLVTAPSDPPLSEHAPFATVTTAAGIFYRREAARHDEAPPATPASRDAAGAAGGPRARHAAAALGDVAPGRDRAPAPRRIEDAADALAAGEYRRAVELVRDLADDPDATVVAVRALANLDLAEAERVCAAASRRHVRSAELQALAALVLLELGRAGDAAAAARRALYLDGTLAVAHFTLGVILGRQGDAGAAVRCYRRARDLCAARPDDEPVPLGDGERCGRLAAAAQAQIALLTGARSGG